MTEVKRILFSVLKATSTINQAKLIEKLVRERGFDVEYKSYPTIWEINKPDVHGVLWFQLASIAHLYEHTPTILSITKPKAVYVTIEGIPQTPTHVHPNLQRIPLIAVSEFVADCLRKARLNVIDVVHHAVDIDLCVKLRKKAEMVRKRLKEEFKDRVIFLYVGRNDPRKALVKLAIAVRELSQNRSDFVVLLKTEASARKIFDGVPNVKFVESFGSTSLADNLALIGACDYLVFPSVCEGFGLPVLEANAMGKPVVHCWFPPLSEFSSEEFNFVFNYDDIELVKCGLAQYWIFHDYDPLWLSDTMNFAIDVYRNSPEEYREYCEKAFEHAKNWDYRKIYPKLLKHIRV